MLWQPTKPLCVNWAALSQAESLSVHWAETQARTTEHRTQQESGLKAALIVAEPEKNEGHLNALWPSFLRL